jgi:hypothetical protein
MGIPANAQAIWNFLIGQGFSNNAAAGIEGNIEQESGGSPTAGSNPPGAGLIQILGDPGGSLSSELQKTMAYIRANGSVSDINAHASTAENAALWFSQKYERPLASAANNPNRESSAAQVLQAATSGKWPSSPNGSAGSDATTTGILSNPIISAIEPVLSWTGNQLLSKLGVSDLKDALERLGLILLGVALILLGLHMLGQNIVSVGGPPQQSSSGSDTTSRRSVAKGQPSEVKKTERSGAGKLATESVEAAAVA